MDAMCRMALILKMMTEKLRTAGYMLLYLACLRALTICLATVSSSRLIKGAPVIKDQHSTLIFKINHFQRSLLIITLQAPSSVWTRFCGLLHLNRVGLPHPSGYYWDHHGMIWHTAQEHERPFIDMHALKP